MAKKIAEETNVLQERMEYEGIQGDAYEEVRRIAETHGKVTDNRNHLINQLSLFLANELPYEALKNILKDKFNVDDNEITLHLGSVDIPTKVKISMRDIEENQLTGYLNANDIPYQIEIEKGGFFRRKQRVAVVDYGLLREKITPLIRDMVTTIGDYSAERAVEEQWTKNLEKAETPLSESQQSWLERARKITRVLSEEENEPQR